MGKPRSLPDGLELFVSLSIPDKKSRTLGLRDNADSGTQRFHMDCIGSSFHSNIIVKEAQKQTMNMKNNRMRNKLNNSSIC